MSGLKFNDVFGENKGNWDAAWDILNAYPRCLSTVPRGKTRYRVTPSATATIDGKEHKFALAAILDGRKLMDTPYIVVDGRFGALIAISENDEAPILWKDGAELNDFNAGAILTAIHIAVDQRKTADHERIEEFRNEVIGTARKTTDKVRSWAKKQGKDFQDWYFLNSEDFWGGVMGCLVISVIIGIFACAVYFTSDDDQASKIATFDNQHPGLVIDGQRFDIGSSGPLHKVGGRDLEIGVPAQPYDEVDRYPRLYNVATDTCTTVDSHDNYGHLNGNEYVLVESNAPKDIIQVKVNASGSLYLCATDPDKVGTRNGPVYDVLMQTQKVA